MKVQKVPLLLACFTLSAITAPAQEFENLGMPIRVTNVSIGFVTDGPSGKIRAWGTVSGDEERKLLGFDIATGKQTVVDLLPYRKSNIQIARGQNGSIYVYTGIPGRFLKYNPKTDKLTDLGIPNSDTRYWLGGPHAIGPDDTFYVGTYPEARLVGVNMRTDKTLDLGRLTSDDRQLYIINPAVSDDNIVYAPVGLHHRELWSVDPKTGKKNQILPKNLQDGQGAPTVWTGIDGQVYGRSGSATFLCKPGGIELGKTADPRKYPERVTAGNIAVRGVDDLGRLILDSAQGAKNRRYVQTDFAGVGEGIYSLGDVANGWLFGSAIKPGKAFAVHLTTGETRDLGLITRGRIQVYDFLNHEKGLFAASYTGGHLELLDVDDALNGKAGKSIIQLSGKHGQERPNQLIQGPDGGIYTVTTPVKGHLGGALVRIDPADLSTKVWRHLIPDQSLMSAAPVAKTGELFVASDVRGGTGTQPSASEAFVFLWDPKKEEVVHKAQPVRGARRYGAAVTAKNGLIYGIAQKHYYAFDPVKRETVHVGVLPTGEPRFPGLHPEPIGNEGLIYGIAGGAVIAIDPRDHSVSIVAEHESLKRTHGFYVTDDKVLYYGSGPNLMRVQLP